MIRAGITGGSMAVAGEIIKILINHPDVELSWVSEPAAEGALLSQIHKGLRGETYMRFSADVHTDNVDVIFLCSDTPGESRDFIESHNVAENTKIVDLSGDYLAESTFADGDSWIYGLPELSRKPLVRGGLHSSIPSALSSMTLLMLLPMAKEHALKSEINITAAMAEENAEPGEALALLDLEEADDIARALKSLQPDFEEKMRFVLLNGGWKRGISAVAHFDCDKTEQEIISLYDDFYSDHGFTFLSDSLPNLTEVTGTNKCIINLQKVDGRLVVTAVMDDLIKGAAAMAVHNMNLLFGLQERVGLMLKTHA